VSYFKTKRSSKHPRPGLKLLRGPHYNADATMAVPQPYLKQVLHFLSCERYHELQASHF